MPEPLKAVLLTSRLSSAAGGLAASVPGMAKYLNQQTDIEVKVLGLRDPKEPNAWRNWGPEVHALSRVGPAALEYSPRLSSKLSDLDPDVVDVQGLWTYPSRANQIVSQRRGRPYMITPRGMLDPWARQNARWKKEIVGWLYEWSHLKNASCLRATAEMEAEHFRTSGLSNPIAIVPNAIEIPHLAPRNRKLNGVRRVLFMSRIHPKKGIEFLLRAWPALEAKHSVWELVVAGIDEREHETEMKKLARNLALKRVKFPGAFYGDEKDTLYRSADVFVLPTHAENFGLVVAEALAQEVPVITTWNAPWSGLNENGCGWWIPLDQRKLTDTMNEAMSMDANELHSMGVKGRNWVQKNFGWAEIVERMSEVYLWLGRGASQPSFVFK